MSGFFSKENVDKAATGAGLLTGVLSGVSLLVGFAVDGHSGEASRAYITSACAFAVSLLSCLLKHANGRRNVSPPLLAV